MKITFLGTGTSQGVPVIGCECGVCTSIDFQDNRLRSSVYIEVDDLSLVIDTGPDFRQQMLRSRVKKLDAVLFTHAHKDHTAGMDDIRSFNFLQKMDMPIYATDDVITQLKEEFAYVFSESKYPGVPRVIIHPITNASFTIGSTQIQPIQVMHHKLPVLGFRINDFTYITDANHIANEEKEKIKDSKVLVLNALQKKEHISHFTLDQALGLIDELKPEKAFITHISHKLGKYRDIKKELPDNVEQAWDGLVVKV
ncbi:MAG: MBL fold metallo-hydrolase [Cytophagales bacterium]|nr:MBL fold metallo-hydrolase [Cytophagales bacterium]